MILREENTSNGFHPAEEMSTRVLLRNCSSFPGRSRGRGLELKRLLLQHLLDAAVVSQPVVREVAASTTPALVPLFEVFGFPGFVHLACRAPSSSISSLPAAVGL